MSELLVTLAVTAEPAAVPKAFRTELLEELSVPGVGLGGVPGELGVTPEATGTVDGTGVTAEATGVTADTTGSTADTTGVTAETTGVNCRHDRSQLPTRPA